MKTYSQEFSTLKSVGFISRTNTYDIKISNKEIYDLLVSWTDQTITRKYTGVPGIISFKITRNILNEIKAEVSKENLVFLLKNYLDMSDNDILIIQNTTIPN